MVSSPMTVSPRETRGVWHSWRGPSAPVCFLRRHLARRRWRRSRGFSASARRRPAAAFSRSAGSCCQRDLIAGRWPGLRPWRELRRARPRRGRPGDAPGSIENLRLIDSGQLESGFAQADLAGWAYTGVSAFADGGPLAGCGRSPASFPKPPTLSSGRRARSTSLADLKGKRVSLGEAGSGTAADATVLLAAAGLGGKIVTRKYLRPRAGSRGTQGGLARCHGFDGGHPVPAIRELAPSGADPAHSDRGDGRRHA